MTDKHSTSDILERLRAMVADKALAIGDAWNGLDAAADEIERLRAACDAHSRDAEALLKINSAAQQALDDVERNFDALRARIEGAPHGIVDENPDHLLVIAPHISCAKAAFAIPVETRVALVVLDE